jgi:hypothetical protein
VRRNLRRTLLVAGLALPGLAHAQLPASTLAVRRGGEWVTWWRSAQAPARWSGPLPAVANAVRWQRVAAGVESAELRLAGEGEAWRMRVVLVRADPRWLRLSLARASRMQGLLGNWTVDSASAGTVVALNAGQFTGGAPWGWVVREGREEQPPGSGSLGMALVEDATGAWRLVDASEIAAVRAGGVRNAFQSYPALLTGAGEVPAPLRGPERGVDLAHRDARLAIGTLADGRVLIALTRFDALGGALDELPFGPTTPEMAALMGALGCRRAMLLDGGISGQLLLRPAGRPSRSWPGMRKVTLGLELAPR